MITSPDALYQLFRGRPYTKAYPFSFSFTGVAGENTALWVPNNAFFELAGGTILGSAAAEFQLHDGNTNNPFAGVVTVTNTYVPVQLGGQASYRSIGPAGNCKLLLVDVAGVINNVRGFLYGWEVTPEGFYR